MRFAALIISLMLANAAFASDSPVVGNGFDASNRAEFTGHQSYSQNNYSNGDNYNINGVKCPVPTLYLGGNASNGDYNNYSPKQQGIALGIQIPLFTGRCDDAANAELRTMEWRLQDAQLIAARKAQQHQVDLMRICAGLMEKGYELPDEYCQGVEKVFTEASMSDQLFIK